MSTIHYNKLLYYRHTNVNDIKNKKKTILANDDETQTIKRTTTRKNKKKTSFLDKLKRRQAIKQLAILFASKKLSPN